MADTHDHDSHYHPPDPDALSVEKALRLILSFFSVLPAESIPLLDAIDRVIAEDLRSEIDVPPFANSAMDGYAVRLADVKTATPETPVELDVSGVVAAGQLPDHQLIEGAAIRIMTGAPIPEGTDAVVPFEDTDETDRRREGTTQETIGVRVNPKPGANLRMPGEDVKRDEIVIPARSVLGFADIGVIASLGISSVSVIRKPVVAIISTGDELIEPGEQPEAGKIYNSNAYTIAAAIQRYGAIPRLIGVALDTSESLNQMLDASMDADMILTSAGVSRGDYDVVKEVLVSRGQIAIHSVRMKPARPLAFGAFPTSDGHAVPHLGLPGNPVAVAVVLELFARPAVDLMSGRGESKRRTVQAKLDGPITNRDRRRVYARVVVYRSEDGSGYRARPSGGQGSGLLTTMARANGLAICPEDSPGLKADDQATVMLLDWSTPII